MGKKYIRFSASVPTPEPGGSCHNLAYVKLSILSSRDIDRWFIPGESPISFETWVKGRRYPHAVSKGISF